MTYKENITAILECCFAGFKEEIIEGACNRILEIAPKNSGNEILEIVLKEDIEANCPKMTKEEIINGLKLTIGKCLFDPYTVELFTEPISFADKITIDACKGAIDLLEQEHTKEELVSSEFDNGYAKGFSEALEETLKYEPVLDKIRAEIKQKIEQERFARSVFRGEEKDADKAKQCTVSIMAYDNVISIIDKYRTGRSEKE